MYSCKNLAQVYQPLAHELLNAAFMSVWAYLNPCEIDIFDLNESASNLVQALGDAIEAPNMPQEILHYLLNLVEFVEMHDKKIPIDIVKVGEQSRKAHALAKCLRCKESEFEVSERSERAFWKTSILAIKCAKWLQTLYYGYIHY